MKRRLDRKEITQRIAQEIPGGAVVNLGIGMPSLVAEAMSKDQAFYLQAENGVLGFRGLLPGEEIDWNCTDASGRAIGLNPGAAFFNSADCFDMIRGGHVDITVLGALQVSEQGDLANWFFPEYGYGNIGGGMDLAAGAGKLFVAMEHTTKTGESKILRECSYPLTAIRVVKMIFTDLAVISVERGGLVLKELAPGWTIEEVQALTAAKLIVDPAVREKAVAAWES